MEKWKEISRPFLKPGLCPQDLVTVTCVMDHVHTLTLYLYKIHFISPIAKFMYTLPLL
jgi:hypothetical protein